MDEAYVQSDLGHDLLGPRIRPVPVDDPPAGALIAQEDVLRDRQVRAQGELLSLDRKSVV